MTSIFVLGATGYIGGAVLFTFLQKFPQLKATALVRGDAQIAILSKHGITCIKGTNQDTSVVTELASKADIVLNAADADDLGLLEAILEGCKQRFTATSVKPIYIHTSGTAVFMDRAEGVFNSSTPVYDDRNLEAIKTVSPTAPHRNVEQSVIDADEAGYVSAYVMSPSGVYGKTPSPIPRAVLMAKILIDIGRNLKALPYMGNATNAIALIHVKDMAAAYVAVLELALSGKDKESGYGKYYIVAGSQVTWNDVIKAYGPSLKAHGIIDTTDPKLVTMEEVPFMRYLAANVKAVAGRLQDLGWKPVSPSILEETERDVEVALNP